MTDGRPAEAHDSFPTHADAEGPPSPQAHTPLPEQLGRFRLGRVLGQGAAGVVYLASDDLLGRVTALKVPRPERLFDPEARRRFLAEARAAGGLDHPNVVAVYEAGEAGPLCYIASACCPGPDLAKWLAARAEPVPFRLAAGLVAATADGVQHAHDRGVLHRDLKPSNVLLDGDPDSAPVPKVTDFGLAKSLEGGGVTLTGVVLGTPAYMAPEQARGDGKAVGPAADVYGLGVILYELLTGRVPFRGSELSVLRQACDDEPPPPRQSRPGVPADLEAVCLKCLEKPPGRRYGTAAELAADLRRFLAGEPTQARPAGPLGRLPAWFRRPERAREAGLFAVTINAALAVWAVLTPFFISYEELGLPSSSWENVGRALALSLALHAPLVAAGLGAMRGRRRAVWVGLAVTAAELAVVGAALAGVWNPFPDYDKFPFVMTQVFSLLGTVFTLQGAAFALALPATARRG